MKQILTLSLLAGAILVSDAGTIKASQLPMLPGESHLRSAAECLVAGASEVADLHELPLIENLPEGYQEELYSRDSFFFARDGQGQLYNTRDFGGAGYVAASDTEVYIKNPFAGWPTGTWIKGERNGDKVTFTFPQYIYFEEYPDWDNDPDETLGLTVKDNYYAYKFILHEGEDKSSFVIDNDNPTISFTFDGDVLREDGDAYIGMIGEYRMYDDHGEPYIGYNWMGFADGLLEYSRVNAKPIEVPEDVVFEKWLLDNGGELTFVDFAIDGDDAWLRGFIQTAGENGEYTFPAIKGHFADGKLNFSGVQYLGIDPRYGHLAYAMPATYEEGTGVWEGETVYSRTSDLVFEYDESMRVFSASEGHALVVSSIPDGIFTIMALDAPKLKWQDMSTPLVPSMPSDLAYEFWEDYGFGAFGFMLEPVTDDGRLMDTSNLYYTIFVDGEPFTFYPDEYWDLEDPMTDVPYDYWDSSINSFGPQHEVLLFVMEMESIGVQAKYVNVDGSVTTSEIATLYTSGISNNIDNATVKTEWFDLTGCKYTEPKPGLMVRRDVKSDGSVTIRKVMIKR